MAERRPLVEGLHTAPPASSTVREQEFVYGKSIKPNDPPSIPSAVGNSPSTPFSTRIRADYAAALKRASLERQLNGTKPNSLREILEAALEPWLKANGYLS